MTAATRDLMGIIGQVEMEACHVERIYVTDDAIPGSMLDVPRNSVCPGPWREILIHPDDWQPIFLETWRMILQLCASDGRPPPDPPPPRADGKLGEFQGIPVYVKQEDPE